MMPTPINNSRHDELGHDDDFHAGHFLRETLDACGHDTVWLAARTNRTVTYIEDLLEQPNMDAELFVRIGKPLEPLFMQRVHESIFGKKATA